MLKRKCDGYVGRGGKCLFHQSIIYKSLYIYLYIYIDIYKHIVKWQLNVNNSIPPPTHTSTQSFAHYIPIHIPDSEVQYHSWDLGPDPK